MNNNSIITKRVSTSLKGISAIEIMFGHLGISTNFIFLYPNRKAGILFVGLFFLLSGYGLMSSLANRNNFFDDFIGRRLVKIIMPAVIVYFSTGLIELTVCRDAKQILSQYLSVKQFFKSINWYVYEIIAFYLVFYILYKYLNKRLANIILFILTICFILIAYFYRIENPWYGSSICFPLGVLYSQNEYYCNEFLKRGYWVKNLVLLGLCFLFIIVFFAMGNESILGNPIARNIAAASFVMWIISLLLRIRVDYVIFRELGKISYEIFLIHPFWILFMSKYSLNLRVYFIITIVFSVCSAYIIHFFTVFISKMIRKTGKIS